MKKILKSVSDRNILIIDDDPYHWGGYLYGYKNLQFAAVLDTAKHIVEKNNPPLDLILLDMIMPSFLYSQEDLFESYNYMHMGFFFYDKYLRDKDIPIIIFTGLNNCDIELDFDWGYNVVGVIRKQEIEPRQLHQLIEKHNERK